MVVIQENTEKIMSDKTTDNVRQENLTKNVVGQIEEKCLTKKIRITVRLTKEEYDKLVVIQKQLKSNTVSEALRDLIEIYFGADE